MFEGLNAGTMLLVTNDRGEYLVDPDAERTFGFDCSRLHRAEVRLAEHAWQLKQFNQLAVGRELRMIEANAVAMLHSSAERVIGPGP